MRSRHQGPAAVVVAAFAVSRIAAYVAGVRFDAQRPLNTFWQYIDPQLLRHDLLSSLWHFSYQPPLFNLVLGVDLKLFGSHWAAAAQVLWMAIGLGGALTLYASMTGFGVRPWHAAGVAGLFTCTSTAVLFENWLFYEYPIAMAVLASVALLGWVVRKPTTWRVAAFLGLWTAIMFVRTVFQPFWLAFLVAALLVLLPHARRNVVIAAIVPVLLVGGLVVKVHAQSGEWGTGLRYDNTPYLANLQIPPADRVTLVREHRLSPMSLIGTSEQARFQRYIDAIPRPARTGIPVLDDDFKSTGSNNRNSLRTQQLGRRTERDVVPALKARPLALLGSRYDAVRLSLVPTTDYAYVEGNRRHIGGWDWVTRHVLLLQTPIGNVRGSSQSGIALTVVAAYLLVALWGAGLARRALRDRRLEPEDLVLLYAWCVVLYLVAIDALFGTGDAQRYRLLSEPVVWLLVPVIAVRWVRRRRQAEARAVPDAPAPAASVA